MIYSLMIKDIPVIGLDISDNGQINSVIKPKNPEFLPFAYRNEAHGIEKWWKERSIPVSSTAISK